MGDLQVSLAWTTAVSSLAYKKLDKLESSSTFEFRIAYTDLKIYNRDDICVGILGDVITSDSLPVRAVGQCSYAYSFLDGRLKQHNQKVAVRIRDFFDAYLKE